MQLLNCLNLKANSSNGVINKKYQNIIQQNKVIKGKVVDDAGIPLPGVTITIVGSSKGVITDLDGLYTIEAKSTDKLLFSFVGLESKIIEIKDQSVIDVVLEEKVDELDEVLVVAFGKQKKTDVIGSVSTITPKDLKVPSSNLTTSLAGRLAGVISYQRSGEPGLDNAEFFIRGVTTFGYKKDPLILIDGIELNSTELARLQPDDISSFSIMKDATATALYGARGANGVILVTTKEGKEGSIKVNLRYESSLSSPTRNLQLADPITYMRLENEAVVTRDPLGFQPNSDSKIDNTIAGTNPLVYPATDWRKEVFKDNALNHRLNFNLSGGGKIASYYIAGTFNQDNGILKVDSKNNFNSNIDLKSYALRSNINIKPTETTEIGVRLYGTFDDYMGPIYSGSQMYKRVMQSNPVKFPAFFPVDEDHLHVGHIMFGGSSMGSYINPYADLIKGYKEYSKSLMLAQFELKQDLSFLTEGLTLRGLFNTNRESYFDVSRSYVPFLYEVSTYDKYSDSYKLSLLNPNTGTEYLGYSEGDKIVKSAVYLESALNYVKVIDRKHNFNGMLVFIMRNYLEGNASSLVKSLPYRNIGLSGRGTYSYDNRYFLEYNFGYNGSERFYKDKQFGFFPSAGAAWTISNEEFWKPMEPYINKLKLRATYGLVGNDAIGTAEDRFFHMSSVSMNDASHGAKFGRDYAYGQNGIFVTRYDNRDITWETSKKTNLALELGLFNQFDIQMEYFNEYRENILMTRANIPTTMGLSAPMRANVGEASSSGVDLSLDYTHMFNNDAWITGRCNFTYATSKYEKIEEPEYDEKNLSKIGLSLSQEWGYIAERLFIDESDVANSPVQNFGIYAPGDIKYRDVNGDGQITTLDRVPIGYPTQPEIIYGFGVSTGIRNLDFSFFFQGSALSSFWINHNSSTSPFVDGNQVVKAYADSYWSEENRNIYAIWPRLSTIVNSNNEQRSTWFMRDGSFLRLKSVEIGYTIPNRITNKLDIENFRLYASGSNLFTFSKFKLWDVEMGSSGLNYPIQKIMNFGVQVTF